MDDVQKVIDEILKDPSPKWRSELKKKLYDIKSFHNKFYVYINQVFGAQIYEKIF